MREYASKLLGKALDAIEGAEALLDAGKAEIAVGRAYYSMFYVAEALLYNELDLKLNQHGQVIAAYGKHFAKTKQLDPTFHRWLRDGFETRITGDYGVDTGIEEEIASNMINQAREFLQAAKAYLEKQG
ncbi:MAG: HEPN domain-containing protein [Chloroflexota bacterium]